MAGVAGKSGGWNKRKARDFEALIGVSTDYAMKVMTDNRFNADTRLKIAGIVLSKAIPSKSETDVNMRGNIKLELEQMREEANKLLQGHLAANERAD